MNDNNPNNPELETFLFVDKNSDFPIQNLPFGCFTMKGGTEKHIASRIGDWVIDLTIMEQKGFFSAISKATLFQDGQLNLLMSKEKKLTTNVRNIISGLFRKQNRVLQEDHRLRELIVVPIEDVELLMPLRIGACTDFYSSKEHASNIGRMFRGENNPLLPNWLHLPVGYDSRASTVNVSGTNFIRPKGQLLNEGSTDPIFDKTEKLGCEVEVGFFIGVENDLGIPIPIDKAPDHIFGMVLFNDWSARDIQKWEYQPLGPFLGKNFFSTISPWIVTMDA